MKGFEEALEKYESQPKEDKLITKVIGILHKMEKAKKDNNMKEFVKLHESLDSTIHKFAGTKGLTPDEK